MAGGPWEVSLESRTRNVIFDGPAWNVCSKWKICRVSYTMPSDSCHVALDGLSFGISAEGVGLVGESGAGKTTLALAICGLLPANARIESGSVVFKGRELLGLPERELRKIRGAEIALISQEPAAALNPVLCVEDQIAEVLRAHGVEKGARRAAVRKLLRRVRLPDTEGFCRSYPHEISGGERQRVVIGQALACDPSLLIADEPTTALDAVTQGEILDLLRELKAEMGLSLLLISHDPAVLAGLVDRVIVIRAGRATTPDPRGPDRERSYPYAGDTGDRPRAGPLWETDPLLAARNLCKSYPRRTSARAGAQTIRALDGVSVTLRRGSLVALIGESGSGKSTLARCLTGAEKPDSGEVLFEGQDFLGLSTEAFRHKRRSIQMVFQDSATALNPWFTVEDLIAEPLRIAGAGRHARREKSQALAEQTGLPQELLGRKAGELSGGQRQRVAIARALAAEPRVMILDEPFSGLDRLLQEQILKLLESLRKRSGIALLVISHDLGLAASIADELAVMRKGQILESGPTAEMLSAPRHRYTQSLLAAASRWTLDAQPLEDRS